VSIQSLFDAPMLDFTYRVVSFLMIDFHMRSGSYLFYLARWSHSFCLVHFLPELQFSFFTSTLDLQYKSPGFAQMYWILRRVHSRHFRVCA